MKTKPGSELHPEDRAYVLRAFVHRFTREHRPGWTRRADCAQCPVQFASDADWLAHTRFAVRNDVRIDRRADCESSPTWPDNPELRRAA